jgi:hypothetical protein
VVVVRRFGDHKHLGSGNITSLTGLLTAVLPDVLHKIETAFVGVHEDLEWGNYYKGTYAALRDVSVVFFIVLVWMWIRGAARGPKCARG